MERLIKTEQEYEAALALIENLMDADPGTEDAERLEYWVTLVKLYEDEHYPMDQPGPVQAIMYAMEQQGLAQKDLISLIGSKSKVSEVLSGKRPLSLNMIRRLHAALGIPLDTLIGALPEEGTAPAWTKPSPPTQGLSAR